MADISKEIAKFQNAVYGEEVRGAMVDLCNKVNDETEAGTDTITEYGKAESARATAESKRASAESKRVSAESNRVSAESNRVSAESNRVSAESARVTEFDGMKSSLTVALTSSGETGSYVNTYTIKQGTTDIGTINIPKDKVVTSGTLVTNPTSSLTGDYIRLAFANTSKYVYISVDKLHDIYTGGTTSTINMAVSSSNVVTGSIVNGSLSKAMLNSDLQTSIANIATNTANIATNTANIATNKANIATNKANIATNTANIATNKANIATNTANIATALCYRGDAPTSSGYVDFDSINEANTSYKSGYYKNNGKKISLSCIDGSTVIGSADWGLLIYFTIFSLQIYITGDGKMHVRTREGTPATWNKWRKCYVS